jgi:RIO-like serine/threonine protein kinase
VKLLADGATADVFLNNDNRVIKLFKGNFSKEVLEQEANNQKMIYEMGIPVPKIYDIIELNGRYGIVMEYIKGISLGKKLLKSNNYVNGIKIINNISENMEKIIYYFNIIIDLQIKINSIILRQYPLMKDKLTRKINEAKYLDKYQKSIFLKMLEKIKFKNNLCHGDLHPYNLIETGEGIKIIDWADATIGNTEADIYRSYLIYRVTSPEIGKVYLDIYCKKTKTEKEKVLAYEAIITAARLSENISKEESGKIMNILKKYM